MEQGKSLSDQLEERLIEFAARIVMFSTELTGTPAGKHISAQIQRSGTNFKLAHYPTVAALRRGHDIVRE